MSNGVFVLDTNHVPQTPVHAAVARKRLTAKTAAVFKRFPFTIIMKTASVNTPPVHTHRLKIDPGSKTTGLALLDGDNIVWAAELTHRGQRIKDALETRRAVRRNRRQRQTRYRQARFDNRTRPDCWLAPSLQSRVDNVMTWVERLARLCKVTALSQELVRFDMQLMQNPDISGVEYRTSRASWLATKCASICWRNGTGRVPIAKAHISPCRLNTSLPGREAARTASQTSRWHVSGATKKRARRLPPSLAFPRSRRRPGCHGKTPLPSTRPGGHCTARCSLRGFRSKPALVDARSTTGRGWVWPSRTGETRRAWEPVRLIR